MKWALQENVELIIRSSTKKTTTEAVVSMNLFLIYLILCLTIF